MSKRELSEAGPEVDDAFARPVASSRMAPRLGGGSTARDGPVRSRGAVQIDGLGAHGSGVSRNSARGAPGLPVPGGGLRSPRRAWPPIPRLRLPRAASCGDLSRLGALSSFSIFIASTTTSPASWHLVADLDQHPDTLPGMGASTRWDLPARTFPTPAASAACARRGSPRWMWSPTRTVTRPSLPGSNVSPELRVRRSS